MDSDYSNTHHSDNSTTHHHKASPSDLIASAKIVAEAAQSTLRHDPKGYDKDKVADAAADLLCAGSHYAKLDESGYGKYVEKAEDYLHKYGDHGGSAHAPSAAAGHGSGVVGHGDNMQSGHKSDAGGHESAGGGYGEYVKMAQGLMGNHNSSGGGGGGGNGAHGTQEGSGGYGDYVKMAQGFLNK